MIIANNSDDYILKIFQNVLNMFCHDIVNPVNSIMLCASSPNNLKSSEVISDCSSKIINCVNVARYSYCMTNREYKVDISQINRDWKEVFDSFDVNFDEKISELDDFLVQIIFHLLIFVQESINSQNRNKIFIFQSKSQIKFSFENKLNNVFISQVDDLISENILKSEINPMNVNMHFFQYLIKKNNVKILLDENEFVINY